MVNFAPVYFQRPIFVPSPPAVPAMGTALALALVVSGSLAPKAQAACLTTVAENTCATFNSSSASTAIQGFTSLNLTSNRYFQLSLLTNAGVSYTITDLAWSKDGTSFTNFSPVSLSLNANGSRSYTNIVDYGSAIGVPLYLRYTIPSGVAPGAIIEGTLIANDNGSNGGGVLTDSINNYQAVNRQSLSVAVSAAAPAPLPIFGAAGFFAYSRQLRRRIRF
jgi:hypothetical protein